MLSIGIVGLPNVGKSTLFKALTKKQVDIQNYPFTTIDPNVGVVGVPDKRLELLARMSHSAKIVPTAIEFIDIAGLVKGAAQGEGLGNKFLANIREVDAIAEIVRVFEDEKITHVHKRIDPANDIEVINTELILADLETVNKRLEKTKGNDEKTKIELNALNKLKLGLQSGILAVDINLDKKELPLVKELNLLTNKKFIYVPNISEKQLKNDWQFNVELKKTIGSNEFTVLSSTFELLLSESTPEEQKNYLDDMGLKESGLDNLIKKAYSALDLITFLTTGEDETRAWTARAGSPIPQAARAIHTDFEQKFIRAEVINWQELLAAGSRSTDSGQAWGNARQTGKIHTVGKDYIIQDGDVIEIKI
ncbi:MAG: redox-regulated ATPase YchF [Candidatus Yanofskybacteria bacterium]|nr:redox-regulated ATPase YchF [Candidatus Yanofskybacteria bacterium]